MTRPSVFALAMIVAAGCTGSAGEMESAESADLEADIAAFFESHQAALTARDTATLRSMYVDDTRFAWIEDGQVRYRSPDGLLTSLGQFTEGFEMRTEYSDLSVSTIGTGGGWVRARFESVASGPSGFAFSGGISYVVERGPTGQWRIVGGHTSTDAR